MAEFGQIVKLTSSSYLYPLLHGKKSNQLRTRIDQIIEFDVLKKPKYSEYSGLNFHRFHLRQFYDFVYSHYVLGLEVKSTIKKYFDLYGINDDDFDLDSAYRGWLRFRDKKKSWNLKNNKSIFVRQNSSVLSLKQLEIILGIFIKNNIVSFFGNRGSIKLKLIEQCRIYIYYEIGELTVKEISNEFNIPEKTIYTILNRFRNKVLRQKVFSEFPVIDLLEVA